MRIVCKQCQRKRKSSFFFKHKYTKNGFHAICKDCKKLCDRRVREEKKAGTYKSKCRLPRLSDEERADRKQKAKEYQKSYREKNWEELLAKKREHGRKVRVEGINEYGGKCSCCGETTMEFLTLEHLNGRKNEKRRLTGAKAWMRLKSQGWPKHDYTVLCFNCNCAKGIYGTCPHRR